MATNQQQQKKDIKTQNTQRVKEKESSKDPQLNLKTSTSSVEYAATLIAVTNATTYTAHH